MFQAFINGEGKALIAFCEEASFRTDAEIFALILDFE
jgi:hypothetical protein